MYLETNKEELAQLYYITLHYLLSHLDTILQEAQLSLRDHASALSVEIWQNTAQMFDGLHLKRPTTGE